MRLKHSCFVSIFCYLFFSALTARRTEIVLIMFKVGGGFSHTIPIRVGAVTGYSFQRRFLKCGIIFKIHESSSFVSSYLKLFKERLLLKIRFNTLTSKLLQPQLHICAFKFTNFLECGIKNWSFF